MDDSSSQEEDGVKVSFRIPADERSVIEGLRVHYGLKSEAQVFRLVVLVFLAQEALHQHNPQVIEIARQRVMKRKSRKLSDNSDNSDK